MFDFPQTFRARFFRKLFTAAIAMSIATFGVEGAVAQSTVVNICARTSQVETAILAKINETADPDKTCAQVTAAELAGISGTLDVSNQSITALQAGDFAGLTALTDLRLWSNTLESLPAGVFDNLTALTDLNLADTSLGQLPPNVFDNLTALTDLDLSRNSLSQLPANVFDNLTALTDLDLSRNSLNQLPAGVFDNLTALTDLDLNRNSLSQLPAGVFDNLTALTTLLLHRNSLGQLPPNVFDNLTALTGLWLNDNSLGQLPANVFDNLTALTDLDLHGNSLGQLPPNVFDNLTALKNLDLQGNYLNELPPNVFDNLTALTGLWLHDNSLTALPADVFDNLTMLNILILYPSASQLPGLPRPSAAIGDGELRVSWTPPAAVSGAPVLSYQLRWKESADADFAAGNAAAVNASVTARTIPGLTNGAEYTLQVAAENSAGVGIYAEIQSVPRSRPGLPQQLAAKAGDGELRISWAPPAAVADAPVLTYHLRWKESADANFAPENAATVDAPAATYTITELTNGTTYAVQVAAENSVGIGDYANVSAVLFQLDVDGDDKVTALDGLLIARFLLGVPADGGLTDGFALDTNADEIATRIQSGKDSLALDLDGDNDADSVDGILLARYMLGLRKGALRGDFSADIDIDKVEERAAALQ